VLQKKAVQMGVLDDSWAGKGDAEDGPKRAWRPWLNFFSR
jgi:hypothetical protein